MTLRTFKNVFLSASQILRNIRVENCDKRDDGCNDSSTLCHSSSSSSSQNIFDSTPKAKTEGHVEKDI